MSRIKWLFLILLRYYRHLGLRVSFYALLSVLAAVSSPLVLRFLSSETTARLDFDSVMPVLSILATSMLAVSTFSLNIMVSAYRAAAASTTPRVHRILLEDTTTQSVLATFVGAFVYSLASIVLYQAKFYPEETAIVVMGVTIVVVTLVVLAILRWIQHLTHLGSVDNSIDAVVSRARATLSQLAQSPTFGAAEITDETRIPAEVTALCAPQSGYIQLVDVPRLQDCAPPQGALYLCHRPGAYVLQGQIIAQVTGTADPTRLKRLANAFTIGTQRSFEQDATYGLVVLSEIGCKALSPGINDSGTAISTLHSLTALLWAYAANATENGSEAPHAPRVFMPRLQHNDLLDAAFLPIARDGAGLLDVSQHLRRSLAALTTCGYPALEQAAHDTAAKALHYSERGALMEGEMDQLSAIKV